MSNTSPFFLGAPWNVKPGCPGTGIAPSHAIFSCSEMSPGSSTWWVPSESVMEERSYVREVEGQRLARIDAVARPLCLPGHARPLGAPKPHHHAAQPHLAPPRRAPPRHRRAGGDPDRGSSCQPRRPLQRQHLRARALRDAARARLDSCAAWPPPRSRCSPHCSRPRRAGCHTPQDAHRRPPAPLRRASPNPLPSLDRGPCFLVPGRGLAAEMSPFAHANGAAEGWPSRIRWP